MSSIARPPDPCLVAIILIVRSRTGPRLVFHYPPKPLSENRPKITTKGGRRISRTRSRQGRGTDSSSSEESGLSSDDDDDDRERDNQNTTSSSNHVNGSSLVASSLLPGRRASNFGLDEHGCISASPSAIEPQRPGSLGSGRGSTRRRGGVHSDGEEDGGRITMGLDPRRAHLGSHFWDYLEVCGKSYSVHPGHGISGDMKLGLMIWH